MFPKKKQLEKKAYHNPRLVTYGAVREITQAVGNMMMKDGGTVKGFRQSGPYN